MFKPLTKRQKEILDFIKVFTQLNGFAPSLTDIKDHFRLGAVSTIHEHIENLRQKGYLQKELNQARSVRAINPETADADVIEIPILYVLETGQDLVKNVISSTIEVHRSLTPSMGKYGAITIATDEYAAHGILPKDTLILLEEQVKPTQGNVLVTVNRKSTYLASIKNNEGRLMFMHLDTDKQIPYSEYTVHGSLVSLIRSFK